MMSSKAMTVSAEVRKIYGDKQVPLSILVIDGKSAEVALISEAFGTILAG